MSSMKRLGLVAAGLSAMTISGCVYVQADGNTFRDGRWRGNEGVYGSYIGHRDTVSITVASNGCTQRDDFSFDVDRDDGAYRVEFEREDEDHCRALVPEGEELTWSFRELGIPSGARVVVEHYSRR